MKSFKILLKIMVLLLSISMFFAGCGSDELPNDWVLVWYDDFDGQSLNLDKWVYDIGHGDIPPDIWGWGNNELQAYTASTENVKVENGNLVITARYLGGNVDEKNYTSGRIKTLGKYAFKYGKISARVKLIKGRGLWAAFWLLGNNFATLGWPQCGEMDIIECGADGDYQSVGGAIHWRNDTNSTTWPEYWTYTNDITTLLSGYFADDYHVFELEWNENETIWRMDNQEYFRQDITIAERSELHNRYFILLNLAVGSTNTEYTGYVTPDTSAFPASMYVDWVRVYQWNGIDGVGEISDSSSSSGIINHKITGDIAKVYSERVGVQIENLAWYIWSGTTLIGDGTNDSADGGTEYRTITTNNVGLSWFGWGIHAQIGSSYDLSDYDYLVFAFKKPGTGGYASDINVVLEDINETKHTVLVDVTGMTPDTWVTNVVNLSNVSPLDLQKLTMLFSMGGTNMSPGVIYFDDVYFTKVDPTQ